MSTKSDMSSHSISELDSSDYSNDSNLSESFEALGFNSKELKSEENRLREKNKKEERAILKKIQEDKNNKAKKDKAVKSMNDLLAISTKYSKFFVEKFNNECNNNKSNGSSSNNKENEQSKETNVKRKFKTPIYFSGGTLKPYQEEGLLWLINLYKNGINGILADEMGLGKTIQVIALICCLVEKKVPGPYLIVAPMSTLPNWMMEFARFAPKIPVILFHGSKQVRYEKYSEVSKKYNIDGRKIEPVVITSYQVPLSETAFLRQFNWQYLIIDEGHRIKNHECKLISDLKSLKTLNRLLLTGTPLQNNLLELWSLLNFLLPQFFKDADTFDALFVVDEFENSQNLLKEKKNVDIITTIHGVLRPFMLRRLKSDVLIDIPPKKEVLVYCHLTEFQRDLYKLVLQRDYLRLLGRKDKDEEISVLSEKRPKRRCTRNVKYPNFNITSGKTSTYHEEDEEEEVVRDEFESHILRKLPIYDLKLSDCKSFLIQFKVINSMINYKRIVNHPYLVYYPLKDDGVSFLIDEKIVEYSGKMKMLDLILPKLKEGGHKVLLFSTLKILLDIIEDYLSLRNYEYCRLDGDCSLESRQESIKKFNEDPDTFLFLISTRAGGLGLNLTAADTVIFYDRDWNPQADIQAQDRCHRIGQNKPVVVYSFITKGTIDERILERSTAKRRLEKAVIHKGSFKKCNVSTAADVIELQKLLEEDDHNLVIQPNGTVFTDEEIEKLLDRSDLYEEMNKKKENNKK